MQHAARALTLALIAGILAAAPVAASATANAPGTVAATPDLASAAPLSTAKVVIIVGATHSETSHYRDIADSAYVEAVKWSSNVVKVYSPYATWSAVKSAVQGASVVIYLGHGNGWPSPYTYDPSFTTKDGFGLNASAGNGDYNNTYYGEPSIATLQLAPNAVVLLNHLCYASGNSEPGYADPTLSTAMQRVDNYGSAFLRAGARAVIAEGHGSINGMIRDLFSTHQTVLDLWRGQSDYHGHELSFQSSRSSGYSAYMDPDNPSSGYYRSLVGNPDLRTEDVTGVPYTPTDTTPDTLQAPGAATVIGGAATLYFDEGLSSPKGSSLGDGAAVRVENLATQGAAVPGSPTAAKVRELDGSLSGWTSTGLLAPQDSAGPQLWGVDGNRTVSPNGDGIADTLALTLRFSEDVSWSVQVLDGWNVRWQVQGSGNQPSVAWDMLVGGAKLPDGDYTLAIHAEDAWGNDALDAHVGLTVDSAAVFRWAGGDRFATAAAISAASFEPGIPVAYVATGLNFPDALAGAAVAGSQGAPILLVMPNSIPAATAAELQRLQPGRIVVLGSAGVVSDFVVNALGGFTNGGVTRLAGGDRFATAAAISAASFEPGIPVAYVATGLNFPDALAGAAVAGSQGAPILLVMPNSIPAATAAELQRLQPGRIVVLGSAGVVSDFVVNALGGFTNGGVTRLAGGDRFATAAAISAASFEPGIPVAYVATGLNFPDALAGAAVAGSQGAPILLVMPNSIPAATAAELARLHPAKIVILGGTGAVSDLVRSQLRAYAGG